MILTTIIKKDNTKNWEIANPVLAANEFGTPSVYYKYIENGKYDTWTMVETVNEFNNNIAQGKFKLVDSLKKYEATYVDSKGETHIHIIKANSLQDVITKFKGGIND